MSEFEIGTPVNIVKKGDREWRKAHVMRNTKSSTIVKTTDGDTVTVVRARGDRIEAVRKTQKTEEPPDLDSFVEAMESLLAGRVIPIEREPAVKYSDAEAAAMAKSMKEHPFHLAQSLLLASISGGAVPEDVARFLASFAAMTAHAQGETDPSGFADRVCELTKSIRIL